MPDGSVTFDPIDMMFRLAGGDGITDFDLCQLRLAAKAWVKSNGEVSMERALKLPTTPEKHRQSQRDRWLVEAIKLLPEYHLPRSEKSNQAVIDRLELEWKEFVCRSAMWRLHRDNGEPPRDTAPFLRCLFFATSLNRGEALGGKQIKRHVGHVFDWKCP